MRLASIVIWNASQQIIEKGKRIAALLLECEPERGRVRRRRASGAASDGRSVTARPRSHARRASLADLPEDLRGPLAAVADETVERREFPVRLPGVRSRDRSRARHASRSCATPRSTTSGARSIPAIIHGQVHGGIAQGVGQALLEQLLLRSRDRAAPVGLVHGLRDAARRQLSVLRYRVVEIPSPTHPLGMRPAGEGGTTPALGVDDQRHRRCAVGVRRDAHRDAGDAGAHLAGNSYCAGCASEQGTRRQLRQYRAWRVNPPRIPRHCLATKACRRARNYTSACLAAELQASTTE